MKPEKTLSKLGLSLPALILLATLPIPRAIAHDLNLVNEGELINSILVFIPAIIWLVVVLWKKVPKPFLTLLIIGLVYGLLLGLTHQLAWDSFWNGNPPHLGGELAGKLSPFVETILMRLATFVTSVITGIITGGFVGAIATGGLYFIPGDNK